MTDKILAERLYKIFGPGIFSNRVAYQVEIDGFIMRWRFRRKPWARALIF